MAKTAQAVIETKVKDGASAGFRKVDKAMKNTAKQGKVLNQQFRFMRGGLGQVGHQVQDVAVQLQMGQNAMLVFGQQGSQIASLFGPGGALLGAVLAVGAALSMALLPRLFGATEAMKKLKEESKTLVDRFDELAPAQQRFARLLATKEIQAYKDELKILEATERNRLRTNSTNARAVKRFTETEEEHAARIIELDANIKTLKLNIADLESKTDGTTEAFLAQEKAMLKEIETYGMSSRAIEEYTIKQKVLDKELRVHEGLALLMHLAELQRLDEAKAAREADAEDRKKIAKEVQDAEIAAIKAAEKALQEKERSAKQFADGFASSFTNAITTAENFKDAMRMVAKSVVDSLIKMIIQKQIANAIFNVIPASLGGGAVSTATQVSPGMTDFSSGIPVEMIADGGGFTGHGSRSGGVDGKGGFGAILHPNETVIDHTKGQGQGVVINQTKGQSMGGVVVNQTINISTGVQQTVRAEIQNLMPQITNATKSAVADARMRGGAYSKQLIGA